MQKLLRLATVEVKSYNSSHITAFWRLFKDMLEDVLGVKGYKFNTQSMMVDEIGQRFVV